jgi:hypothetical protein
VEGSLANEGLVVWVRIASQQKLDHITVGVIDRAKERSLKFSFIIDPIHISP